MFANVIYSSMYNAEVAVAYSTIGTSIGNLGPVSDRVHYRIFRSKLV